MTRMIPAHPLVRAEWPHIVEVPAYDFQIATAEVHVGVYVRRAATVGRHVLVGLINHVVVTPDARRRGIGGQAVIDAMSWIGQRGVPFAHVHCTPSATKFYERLGFFRVDNFPTPAHRGERVSMIANRDVWWPIDQVEYVEPW